MRCGRNLTSPFRLIVSRKGTAYAKESLGNWFKNACVAAGLLHHNGHGLRRATLRRSGCQQDNEVAVRAGDDGTLAIYTADNDQIRLADEAVTILARWEMPTKEIDRDRDYRFTATD